MFYRPKRPLGTITIACLGCLAIVSSGFGQTTDTGTTTRVETPQDHVTQDSISERAPGNWISDALGFALDRQDTMLHPAGAVNAQEAEPGPLDDLRTRIIEEIIAQIQRLLQAWFATFLPAILTDTDKDGISNSTDNCPLVSNAAQTDTDGDKKGDACDNCPNKANGLQEDTDGDRVGDACDNCLNEASTDQTDTDGDTFGDICDNCPSVANPDQKDSDTDGTGDVCETDNDGDGIPNDAGDGTPGNNPCTGGDKTACDDNCPNAANADQADADSDGVGDVCDNCPSTASTDQTDTDNDGNGDACDLDDDNDGRLDSTDNCPKLANADQLNADLDAWGNLCDNCPTVVNNDQADTDGDGTGDVCDSN